jgi:hypothetical protein
VCRLTAGNDDSNDERERGGAKGLIFVYGEVILETRVAVEALLGASRATKASMQTHNHRKGSNEKGIGKMHK